MIDEELLRQRAIRKAKRGLNLAKRSPSLLFIDDILSGKRKLVDVNAPDAPPGALQFFQNRSNQRLITTDPVQPRRGQFDLATNQAAADARAAQAPAPGGGGVPHRQSSESDQDFHARLVRTGKTDDEALDLVAQRTLLDRSLDERRLERGAQIAARDRRRRIAGTETSAELTLRQIRRLPAQFQEKAITPSQIATIARTPHDALVGDIAPREDFQGFPDRPQPDDEVVELHFAQKLQELNAQPPPDQRTAGDAFRKFLDRPIKAIPFLGGAVDISNLGSVFMASKRLEDGTATSRDKFIVAQFARDNAGDAPRS